MQQLENTRKIDNLVQRALAGGGIAASRGPMRVGRAKRWLAGVPRSDPCEILQRLAKVSS
jgi:hypothetical protein